MSSSERIEPGDGGDGGTVTPDPHVQAGMDARIWTDGRPTHAETAVLGWLLTTTRSCRKALDPSRPVEPEVVRDCLRLAIQAPTAHNEQRWHWVVVTDPDTRAAIGDVYLRTWKFLNRGPARKQRRWQGAAGTDRNADSAAWLAHHVAETPVHRCAPGRARTGSGGAALRGRQPGLRGGGAGLR